MTKGSHQPAQLHSECESIVSQVRWPAQYSTITIQEVGKCKRHARHVAAPQPPRSPCNAITYLI